MFFGNLQNIGRENLYNLPYAAEEIYGLYSSGKYQNTKKIYHKIYRIYSNHQQLPIKPEKIIVEDSNSGYKFRVWGDRTVKEQVSDL